jgi:hypothetical protein
MRLLDSVVFDLCRGPGTVTQVLCSRSRASIERSSEQQKKRKKERTILVIFITMSYGGREAPTTTLLHC